MILITVFYTALGFFGYTAYGENTLGTLPLNMPDTTYVIRSLPQTPSSPLLTSDSSLWSLSP